MLGAFTTYATTATMHPATKIATRASMISQGWWRYTRRAPSRSIDTSHSVAGVRHASDAARHERVETGGTRPGYPGAALTGHPGVRLSHHGG
jgi:hypothetical protein